MLKTCTTPFVGRVFQKEPAQLGDFSLSFKHFRITTRCETFVVLIPFRFAINQQQPQIKGSVLFSVGFRNINAIALRRK